MEEGMPDLYDIDGVVEMDDHRVITVEDWLVL